MSIQLFHVGVKAVISQGDEILLLKHATKGFWDLPGGRVDGNESIEQTLRREVGEELPSSSLVAVGDIVCAYRVPGQIFDDRSTLLLIVYSAEVDFDSEAVEISEEHSEYRWASLTEAARIGSHIVKETVAALQD